MTQDIAKDGPIIDRKPRLALLGEFSAGKSTLVNLLLGQAHSPIRVTATQMPPLWYCEGNGPPMRIGHDGQETPIEIAPGDQIGPGAVAMDATRAVRVSLDATILKSFDIIDMPGSSDPNMSADVWDSLLPLADAVIWCTPATQAWRQSEAAIWEDVPPALHAQSILLLTRMDKVATPENRKRVLSRVIHETNGQFRYVLPVSLLEAQGGPSVPETWTSSGMDVLEKCLMEVYEYLTNEPAERLSDLALALRRARAGEDVPEAAVVKRPVNVMPFPIVSSGNDTVSDTVAETDMKTVGTNKRTVMPRRVTRSSAGGGRRRREANSEGSLL